MTGVTFGKRVRSNETKIHVDQGIPPKGYIEKVVMGATVTCVAIVLLAGGIYYFVPQTPSEKAASADEIPAVPLGILPAAIEISYPAEPQATFTLLHVSKDGSQVRSLHSRHSSQSGWNYTERKYDCSSGRYITLATAETLEGMKKSSPDSRWSNLIQGSSATTIANAACEKAGYKLAVY